MWLSQRSAMNEIGEYVNTLKREHVRIQFGQLESKQLNSNSWLLSPFPCKTQFAQAIRIGCMDWIIKSICGLKQLQIFVVFFRAVSPILEFSVVKKSKNRIAKRETQEIF